MQEGDIRYVAGEYHAERASGCQQVGEAYARQTVLGLSLDRPKWSETEAAVGPFKSDCPRALHGRNRASSD
jgi:hypothetical protein